MRQVAPDGPVYQAGTLAGNPLVTAAGLATLRYVTDHPHLYRRFDVAGEELAGRLTDVFSSLGRPGTVTHVGGMLGVFLGVEAPANWDDVAGVDREWFGRFFRAALERGVMLPPSPFEAWFLMEAHLDGALDRAVEILVEALEVSAR